MSSPSDLQGHANSVRRTQVHHVWDLKVGHLPHASDSVTTAACSDARLHVHVS